jgi:sugar O-acyltransferase (sialic acid O-acetyltransferase NeuD family)
MRISFVGGGHGREVLQLLQDLRANDPAPGGNPADFLLGEGFAVAQGSLKGLRLLVSETQRPPPEQAAVVVAIGALRGRERIVRRLMARGYRRFPTLVHPRTWVLPKVRLGQGCVVFAGSLLSADTTLHDHAHAKLGCGISHDSVLHDFVTQGPGMRICVNGLVGETAGLGAACVLVPHARVGARAIVGAGTVVISEVPADATAVGVPARIVKRDGV